MSNWTGFPLLYNEECSQTHIKFIWGSCVALNCISDLVEKRNHEKKIIWQEIGKIRGQALSLPSIAKEHLGNYITEAEDVPKTIGLASWSPENLALLFQLPMHACQTFWLALFSRYELLQFRQNIFGCWDLARRGICSNAFCSMLFNTVNVPLKARRQTELPTAVEKDLLSGPVCRA